MRLASLNLARINFLSVLGIYLFLVLSAVGLEWAGLTNKPDILLHDTWVRLSERPVPDDVVIVAIDSRSLQEIGRWPWSRDVQAGLVQRIQQAGATTIALDILYTEPDTDSPDNDLLLAQILSQTPNLLLPILTGEYSSGKVRPETLPIPDLTMVAGDLGHVFMHVDPDGLIRRVDLKSGFRAAHWSSFGLALNELLGTAPETLPGDRTGAALKRYGWVSDYRALVPFYGPGGSFQTVSAAALIAGEIPSGALQDKIVFVGVTAVGLGDIHPTPVSTTALPMPGVEIHAATFSALRDGSMVRTAPALMNLLVSASLIAVLLLLYLRLPPSGGLLAALGFAVVPVLLSFFAYKYLHLWYAPLSASLPLVGSFAFWSWHRLEFVGSFIQTEVRQMDEQLRESTHEGPRSLASFLDAALQHLPVSGWVFRSRGDLFSQGEVASLPVHSSKQNEWQRDGQFFFRHYPGWDEFSLGLNVTEPKVAPQLLAMIDSLDRVQGRANVRPKSDLAERLQVGAQQFNTRLNKLRRMSDLAEKLFDDSPAGLIVWNAAGEFVRMNDLAYRMFPDLLNREMTLRDFVLAIQGEQPGPDTCSVAHGLLFDNCPWQFDFNEAGSEKVISFSATGEQLADRLIMASIVDVSAMREAQRTRAEMVEYLSHDLRSPLISSTYLLSSHKDKYPTAEEGELDRVSGYISRSLGMIDDLLNLSRADNLSQSELQPVLFDNIVSNSLDQLLPQAAAKGIGIEVDEDEDTEYWVMAHAILLERALTNVVGNAIKYSHGPSTIRLLLAREGNNLLCMVSDEGIGIDPEKLTVMFERFSRDESVERSHQGTGLGLALVGRVVRQHAGQVYAESEGKGKGTCITIELPLLDDGF